MTNRASLDFWSSAVELWGRNMDTYVSTAEQGARTRQTKAVSRAKKVLAAQNSRVIKSTHVVLIKDLKRGRR